MKLITQEGDLGRQMRAALPNAFLFGLTGTPVNKVDKNTFGHLDQKRTKWLFIKIFF